MTENLARNIWGGVGGVFYFSKLIESQVFGNSHPALQPMFVLLFQMITVQENLQNILTK